MLLLRYQLMAGPDYIIGQKAHPHDNCGSIRNEYHLIDVRLYTKNYYNSKQLTLFRSRQPSPNGLESKPIVLIGRTCVGSSLLCTGEGSGCTDLQATVTMITRN